MIDFSNLKKIDFFADLTEDELRSIQRVCHEEQYYIGDAIHEEGKPAKHLYVLKQGKVSIDIQVAAEKHLSVLTISDSGAPFGWSALVEPFRFTASARCVEDSTVFSIDATALMSIIEKNYRMGFLIMGRLAKLISGRVKNTRLQLISCFFTQ